MPLGAVSVPQNLQHLKQCHNFLNPTWTVPGRFPFQGKPRPLSQIVPTSPPLYFGAARQSNSTTTEESEHFSNSSVQYKSTVVSVPNRYPPHLLQSTTEQSQQPNIPTWKALENWTNSVPRTVHSQMGTRSGMDTDINCGGTTRSQLYGFHSPYLAQGRSSSNFL